MRILVNMEIESPDYGGKEFFEEIKKLIKDIDPYGDTHLIRFNMRRKNKIFCDGGAYVWERDKQ